MRQPQLLIELSPSTVIRKAEKAEPNMSATKEPTAIHDIEKLRLRSWAYSPTNDMAPATSPPAEKPCRTRNDTSRMGAAMPITV